MKTVCLLFVAMVFTARGFLAAASAPEGIDGKTFEERASALLHACASKPLQSSLDAKHAIPPALASALVNGGGDAMQAWEKCASRTRSEATRKLSANPADAHALDPFDKFALVAAWCVGQASKLPIPESITEDTRNYAALYKHREWKGYGALNYRLMNDGAGFLAAEQWPSLRDADGLDSAAIRAATKSRLLGYFHDIVHRNFHEYGSPTYGGVDLSAVKILADHARDSEVRQKAALTLDWMLLNVACAWNHGYHVTPAGRAKYLGSTITSPDDMDVTATIGWLYFGGLRPVHGLGDIHSVWFAVPGTYAPPDIFAAIAAERSQPVVHRASFVDGGREIRMSIFHTPAYSLASEVEFLPGPTDGHYKESRRQMLKWISDKPFSTFTPMQENPRRPYALAENVANAFGYGENPYGQSLQHLGTLVGIISVPEDYPYARLYAPFPTTGSILRRIERGGWVCCHTGNMLFAFRPLREWSWGKPDDRNHCDVLLSDFKKNGWILETSPLGPYAGGGTDAELDRFATALQARARLENVRWDTTEPGFAYTALDGTKLEIRYRPHGQPWGDAHKINGQAVNYASWPLLDNPWVHQDLGSDRLTLHLGGHRVDYDFGSWRRTVDGSP